MSDKDKDNLVKLFAETGRKIRAIDERGFAAADKAGTPRNQGSNAEQSKLVFDLFSNPVFQAGAIAHGADFSGIKDRKVRAELDLIQSLLYQSSNHLQERIMEQSRSWTGFMQDKQTNLNDRLDLTFFATRITPSQEAAPKIFIPTGKTQQERVQLPNTSLSPRP